MKRFYTCKGFYKTHKIIVDPYQHTQHFIGLDVGSKFIGVAISDLNNENAIPYSVLHRTSSNQRQMCTQISQLCSSFSAQAVVVGVPFTHPETLERIKLWVNEIWDSTSPNNILKQIPVILQDETFTTNESYEEYTQDYGMQGYRSKINKMKKFDKEWIDRLSAMNILQRALDNLNKIRIKSEKLKK